MKKLIGHCPVDSGQILIADPCYLASWKDGDFDTDKDLENHYAKACQITLTKEGYGEILISSIAGNGVVSRTYNGDGFYPVYADIDKDGGIKSLTIKFHN